MGLFCYDIEVLKGPDEVEGGWKNPEAMGFGTAVVYDFSKDRYHFYGPQGKQHMVTLMQNGTVISFNGVRFDNRVVFGNWYPDDKFPAWKDIDLLLMVVQSKFGVDTVDEAEEKVGQKTVHDGSIGLDGLSQGTLGLAKSGHGSHAPKMIAAGEWPGVYSYNLNDVRLTRKLYEFAQKYGYLIDRDGNQISLRIVM